MLACPTWLCYQAAGSRRVGQEAQGEAAHARVAARGSALVCVRDLGMPSGGCLRPSPDVGSKRPNDARALRLDPCLSIAAHDRRNFVWCARTGERGSDCRKLGRRVLQHRPFCDDSLPSLLACEPISASQGLSVRSLQLYAAGCITTPALLQPGLLRRGDVIISSASVHGATWPCTLFFGEGNLAQASFTHGRS